MLASCARATRRRDQGVAPYCQAPCGQAGQCGRTRLAAHLLPDHGTSNGEEDRCTWHCERLACGNDSWDGGMDGHKPADLGQGAGRGGWLELEMKRPPEKGQQLEGAPAQHASAQPSHQAGESFFKCARHMPSGTFATTATAPRATSRTAKSWQGGSRRGGNMQTAWAPGMATATACGGRAAAAAAAASKRPPRARLPRHVDVAP